MSNLGLWSRWYHGITEPSPYGLTDTYQMGADWLDSCNLIEDWGCGKGWFKTVFKNEYIGIDGSKTPYSDKVVDLEEYTSNVPGIYMRHVLEHNYNWDIILKNALNSFTKRMALVIFTPESKDKTKEIAFSEDPGVPDISFRFADLFMMFKLHDVIVDSYQTLKTDTQYKTETIFFLYKKG